MENQNVAIWWFWIRVWASVLDLVFGIAVLPTFINIYLYFTAWTTLWYQICWLRITKYGSFDVPSWLQLLWRFLMKIALQALVLIWVWILWLMISFGFWVIWRFMSDREQPWAITWSMTIWNETTETSYSDFTSWSITPWLVSTWIYTSDTISWITSSWIIFSWITSSWIMISWSGVVATKIWNTDIMTWGVSIVSWVEQSETRNIMISGKVTTWSLQINNGSYGKWWLLQWVKSLTNYILMLISLMSLLIPWLWAGITALFSKQRRWWHDRAAGTIVIKTIKS